MDVNSQKQTAGSTHDCAIRYVKIPTLKDSEAVVQFDRIVFACNPNLRAFLRHCTPAEYPPGQFERMCGPSKQLLKLIIRTAATRAGVSLLYLRPLAERPEDFCLGLSNDVAMTEMIRELTRSAYENN